MTDTVCTVDTIRPIEHDEAMDLADAEYERLLNLVDTLRDSDWSQPTDCIGWTVQDILRHLLGMVKLQASPAELARQVTAANELSERNGTVRLHELTALQVAEHAHLTPTELTAALHETAPLGLAARRALPPERRAQPYDSKLPGEQPWTVGHLFDIIHTRDPWVHRVDICRATGHPLTLTAFAPGVRHRELSLRPLTRRLPSVPATTRSEAAGAGTCSLDLHPAGSWTELAS